MIELTISANLLRVVVPRETKLQAPHLLRDIWHDEFSNHPEFAVELTENARDFVEQARLNSRILVRY